MKRRDGVFHFAARVHRAERLIELPQLLYVVRVVEYFGCKRYITVVSRKRVKLRPLSRSREIVRIPLLARLEISGAPRDLNGQRGYIFTDTEPLQRSVKGFYKIGRNTESVQSLRKMCIRDSYTSGHIKYTKSSDSDISSVTLSFEAENSKNVLMYIPSDYTRECKLYVNGAAKDTYFANETCRIVDIGIDVYKRQPKRCLSCSF